LTKSVVNTFNAAILKRATLKGDIFQADVGELYCNSIQKRTIGTSGQNEIPSSTRDCT
jgi:hypothetical protein